MASEAGEYIVGANLQHIHECGGNQYNVRLPGGKVEGPNELDLLGMNLTTKAADPCEVTTHLHGMRSVAVKRVAGKYAYQRKYAKKVLGGFTVTHQLWSPIVAQGLMPALK